MTSSSSASTVRSGRRAIFLDIDGTYADHGRVPAAHVEAVRRARENGHAVLLCTGRPESFLPLGITEGLDGAVTSAGAHVRIAGEVLCDVRVDPALAARAVEVLEQHDVAYALEAPDAMHCTQRGAERMRRALEHLLGGTEGASAVAAEAGAYLNVDDDLRGCSFAKISVWGSPVPIEQLAAEIGEGLRPLPSSVDTGDTASGELQMVDVDKADGMLLVAEHLGVASADTVGIGDGMNDLGMLEAAGTAVGIADGRPEVIERADLVVPGPGEHGIVEAFERVGLI